MINLLTKIKDIIIADLNETLDRQEKQNPIGLLNQYLRQCEQETEKVSKLINRQSSLKDEFTREYNQAEVAIKAGDTELHQFATAEQMQYSERAERLNLSLAQVSEQLIQLEKKYDEMKQRLKDMHLRRMELMGRENVTRANLGVSQVLEPNASQSYSKFKDIENYLDRLENKVNSSFYRSTIDAKIALLEKDLDDKPVNLIKE